MGIKKHYKAKLYDIPRIVLEVEDEDATSPTVESQVVDPTSKVFKMKHLMKMIKKQRKMLTLGPRFH